MKNLIKTVLGIFIKSKIEQRKQEIKDKLEAHKLLTKSLEISTSINYQKGIDLAQNALSSLK